MYDADREYHSMLKRLKEICRQKRVSQYALAKATGMSTSSISSLMKGESRPYIYTVLLICDALGISVQELFGGDQTNADPDEEALLRLYRLLPEEKREQLQRYADMLYQYREERKN